MFISIFWLCVFGFSCFTAGIFFIVGVSALRFAGDMDLREEKELPVFLRDQAS